jgi:hypothetical protein
MKQRRSKTRGGIANAAIEGAQQGQSRQPVKDDAKVDPRETSRATENNEAPLGGSSVAFPAPSAQPTRDAPQQTQRPANVDSGWTNDEDEEEQWRRAGGKRSSDE